jgi:hypothetical protein
MFKDFVLRTMVNFTGGEFSEEMMESLLKELNACDNE